MCGSLPSIPLSATSRMFRSASKQIAVGQFSPRTSGVRDVARGVLHRLPVERPRRRAAESRAGSLTHPTSGSSAHASATPATHRGARSDGSAGRHSRAPRGHAAASCRSRRWIATVPPEAPRVRSEDDPRRNAKAELAQQLLCFTPRRGSSAVERRGTRTVEPAQQGVARSVGRGGIGRAGPCQPAAGAARVGGEGRGNAGPASPSETRPSVAPGPTRPGSVDHRALTANRSGHTPPSNSSASRPFADHPRPVPSFKFRHSDFRTRPSHLDHLHQLLHVVHAGLEHLPFRLVQLDLDDPLDAGRAHARRGRRRRTRRCRTPPRSRRAAGRIRFLSFTIDSAIAIVLAAGA